MGLYMLIVGFILGFVLGSLVGYMNFSYDSQWIATWIGWILGAISSIYIFIRNIVRLVKGDKSIGIFNSNNPQKNSIRPKVNKNLRMVSPKGVVFGKYGSAYIAKPEDKDGHILIIGGAGSGKSSCIAIPSLLSWRDRVFAIDIKGELSKKAPRPNMKIFNPMDTTSFGYDPYELLKCSENRVQDAKEISIALVPIPENTKDPFWIQSAQNFLTACILHFSLKCGFIDTIKAIQGTPAIKIIEEISQSEDSNARLFINQFVGLDQKVLQSIFTELSNKIMLFATDNRICNALSKQCNITPKDLDNKQDIYIVIPEDKLEQWKPLLTLITNQFLKHFERRPEDTSTPVLFLLDEFARLGKIETVINGLATLRSRKITIAILIQSLAQLDAIYGRPQRQIITDNCSYKAILNATDADTQDYFSRLVGTYDKKKETNSNNFDQYTGLGKGRGVSSTTQESRIIKPEEFAYLKDIVLITPFGFNRINKSPYYKDRLMKMLAQV